jgi:hypothetical protein
MQRHPRKITLILVPHEHCFECFDSNSYLCLRGKYPNTPLKTINYLIVNFGARCHCICHSSPMKEEMR